MDAKIMSAKLMLKRKKLGFCPLSSQNFSFFSNAPYLVNFNLPVVHLGRHAKRRDNNQGGNHTLAHAGD